MLPVVLSYVVQVVLVMLLIASPARGRSVGKSARQTPGPADIPRYGSLFSHDAPRDAELTDLDIPIVFSPPFLDFGGQELCSRHTLSVAITNEASETLVLHGVFSHDPAVQAHLACGLLGNGESGNITVMFIPSSLGVTSVQLLLRTNLGVASFTVRGSGVPSRYGFEPLLDLTTPLTTPLKREIVAANPNPDTSVHLVRANTTSPFFTISYDFPDAGNDSLPLLPPVAWEVPPLQKRTVLLLHFRPEGVGVHEGHLALTLVDRGAVVDVLIPIRWTVLSRGLHHLHTVDFGVLTRLKTRSTRPIQVTNTGEEAIILAIRPLPSNIFVTLVRSSVAPGETATIAVAVFEAGATGESVTGEIVIDCDGGASVEVPYRGRVYPGELEYPPNATLILSSENSGSPPPTAPRTLRVVNRFPDPIIIRSAHIQGPWYHLISMVPVVLPPSEPADLLTFALAAGIPGGFVAGAITLTTNITSFRVPLQTYSGHLAFSISPPSAARKTPEGMASLALSTLTEAPVLELGLLDAPAVKRFPLAISNPNPVPISIRGIESASSSLKILGVKRTTLQPWQTKAVDAVLSVSKEGSGVAVVVVKTTQQPRIGINVTYLALRGSLRFHVESPLGGTTSAESDTGTLSLAATVGVPAQIPLSISSSHTQDIGITSVSSSDACCSVSLRHSPTVVKANTETKVGDLLISLDAPGHQPLWKGRAGNNGRRGITQDDIDQLAWYQQAEPLSDDIKATPVISFETNVRKVLTLKVAVAALRAKVVHDNVIDFGVVPVGMTSQRSLVVHNPSFSEIEVAAFRWSDIPKSLQFNLSSLLNLENFKLLAREFTYPKGAVRRVSVPPHSQASLGPFLFMTDNAELVKTAVFLKNPITGVEMITLQGHGGKGVLEILDRGRPVNQLRLAANHSNFAKYDPSHVFGKSSARGGFISLRSTLDLLRYGLLWLNSSYLVPQHFSTGIPQRVPSRISDPIKFVKTFTLTNTGNMGINTTSMSLQGKCEQAGLQLESCNTPLSLPPSGKASLAITFSPDFTTDFIPTELWVDTVEQGRITFPVQGSLPRDQIYLHYDNIPHTVEETAARVMSLMLLGLAGLYLTVASITDILSPPTYTDSCTTLRHSPRSLGTNDAGQNGTVAAPSPTPSSVSSSASPVADREEPALPPTSTPSSSSSAIGPSLPSPSSPKGSSPLTSPVAKASEKVRDTSSRLPLISRESGESSEETAGDYVYVKEETPEEETSGHDVTTEKEEESRKEMPRREDKEQTSRRKREEQLRREKEEEEARRREEEEANIKAEEARKKKEEEARKRKEEEVRKRKEEEAKKKKEEEARKRKEEEARKRKEEEARKRKEEEARKRKEEEARRREEEALRKKKEEETRRRQEEQRRKEEAAQRKSAEEEARRREEARKREEEQHRREEAKRREEEVKRKREEEARRKREEEAKRKRQEERRKREEEGKRRKEEEAKRKGAEKAAGSHPTILAKPKGDVSPNVDLSPTHSNPSPRLHAFSLFGNPVDSVPDLTPPSGTASVNLLEELRSAATVVPSDRNSGSQASDPWAVHSAPPPTSPPPACPPATSPPSQPLPQWLVSSNAPPPVPPLTNPSFPPPHDYLPVARPPQGLAMPSVAPAYPPQQHQPQPQQIRQQWQPGQAWMRPAAPQGWPPGVSQPSFHHPQQPTPARQGLSPPQPAIFQMTGQQRSASGTNPRAHPFSSPSAARAPVAPAGFADVFVMQPQHHPQQAHRRQGSFEEDETAPQILDFVNEILEN